VKDKRSRVFRNSDRTGWNQDEGRKDERSVELTNSSRNQEYYMTY